MRLSSSGPARLESQDRSQGNTEAPSAGVSAVSQKVRLSPL